MLTLSSIKKLDKLANRWKSSRSELVEQFARSQDDSDLVAQTKCSGNY
ncbi:ribbon-helix-helix protein, CopG family [Moorena sp. SIO3F7]|nr:ribbon-helix-helix protein, CopG family [Moorena sp. SIO3F7]NEO16078.1 ribbon-helix-helix protein, CopG family [Moorena sp. SIO3E8]NEQ02599.1 ribbon-helix-helix protein, CopG family [Moorena sp. SIO3F7]